MVPPGMGYGERGVPNVSFMCFFTTYLCCEGVSMFFYALLFILTQHLWCEGDFCVFFFLKTFVVSQVIPGGATLHFTVELLSISDGPPLAGTREL